jgi:hypothetical protein
VRGFVDLKSNIQVSVLLDSEVKVAGAKKNQVRFEVPFPAITDSAGAGQFSRNLSVRNWAFNSNAWKRTMQVAIGAAYRNSACELALGRYPTFRRQQRPCCCGRVRSGRFFELG